MMRLIKNIFLEHWNLKIISIFLSLVLWLFVRGDPSAERVITVALEIQVPRSMEITNERPTSVDVTLRGTISNTWFSQSVPTCIINLQGADEGEHLVPLTANNVRIPRASGIQVLRVSPARVMLVLERTVSKEVPIIVPIQGEAARGFEIYDLISKPATIVITGPRSHIEGISEIPTESVSLAGQKQSTRMFVSLNIRDNMVRTTLAGPIEVDVKLGAHRAEYTIAQVPVATDDQTYTTDPAQISVQLLVPVDFAGSLTRSDLSATIATKSLDLSQLPTEVEPEVDFTGNLDPAIIIKSIKPNKVTVQKNPSEKRQ